jgi:hypothetical protein
MTKTPSPTSLERAERSDRLRADAVKAMAEHVQKEAAVNARTAKLRALRLAKEAAEAKAELGKAPKKVKRTKPAAKSK